MQNNQNSWSEWHNLNEETLLHIPQTNGVFMMHASMKILLIEGVSNLKKSIEEKITQPGITDNTRLRFMETSSYEKVAGDLIKDYKNRHGGENPLLMQ